MSAPHDAPSIAQMVEALREWMERDVITGTAGRLQFHARVARNMLAMIERELELGSDHARDHAARLAHFGCTDDFELATKIRTGELDDSYADVREQVEASVREKLAVANPTYAEK
jgi:Domain of unknown function (DUF6285)